MQGDDHLRRAMAGSAVGDVQTVEPRSALARIAERVDAGGGAGALRFLISAHASVEELFLLGRMGGALGLPADGVAIGWRTRPKPQPSRAKFTIPPVDGPNGKGAAGLGFPGKAASTGGG